MGVRKLGQRLFRRLKRKVGGRPNVSGGSEDKPTQAEVDEILRLIRGRGEREIPDGADAVDRGEQERSGPQPEDRLELKACKECGETKPLDAFYKVRRHGESRRGVCRACMSAAYYAAKSKAEPTPRAPDGYQQCTKCSEIKPLADYSRDRSKPSGRRPSCKICDREQRRRKQEALRPSLQHPCPICRAVEGVEQHEGACSVQCARVHRERQRQRKVRRAEQKRRARERRKLEREKQATEALDAGSKACERCGESKGLDSFPRRTSTLDGRARICSVCVAQARGAPDPEDLDRMRLWERRKQELLDLVPRVEDNESS